MKPIQNVSLSKCFEAAQAEVQADLEAQVVKQIKGQLMSVAQLKIKAENATIEANKLNKQLEQKEQLIGRMSAGDWSAVPDSAKERDAVSEATEK